MSSTIPTLESLADIMREALRLRDWGVIASLDLQCRELAAHLAISEDQNAQKNIEDLLQLYSELEQAARNERERVAGELTRLSQSKQVNKAYSTFD
ncbi:flagellar protein FliT [Stutzerimonas kunmingensis]|uniref:flagellar protein FliT n=1 Tax=Stutzerimonas kunmingensis TaxID=1211807 RepID=UPI0028B0F0CF|nr:flagellar protein FliT [Stutzerimonas kunmingensis]